MPCQCRDSVTGERSGICSGNCKNLDNFINGCNHPNCLAMCCNEIRARLTKLENKISEKYAHPDVIGRIERLENRYDSFAKYQHPRLLQERIDKLESQLAEVKRFQDITHEQFKMNANTSQQTRPYERKKPHKCPVCDGSQRDYFDVLLPTFQYPSSTMLDHEGRRYQNCRVCEGKGIVWG